MQLTNGPIPSCRIPGLRCNESNSILAGVKNAPAGKRAAAEFFGALWLVSRRLRQRRAGSGIPGP